MTDKMDGEFRVPLDMGIGSQKMVFVECPNCKDIKYVKKICCFMYCKKCNSSFNPQLQPHIVPDKNFHFRTPEAKAYSDFRDTLQIKADLYQKGIRRRTHGGTIGMDRTIKQVKQGKRSV